MITLMLDDFNPAAIAESGQCFRMRQVEAGADVPCEACFELLAGSHYLRIWEQGGGQFSFSCTQAEWDGYFRRYFDLDTDYAAYRAYCLEEDSFLKDCMAVGRGIRILNQEPFEMLISFLLSQRKSIPAIRTSVERMCLAAGARVDTPWGERFAFPEPDALAALSPEALASCGLGYRAPYVRNAARQAAAGLFCEADGTCQAAVGLSCEAEDSCEADGSQEAADGAAALSSAAEMPLCEATGSAAGDSAQGARCMSAFSALSDEALTAALMQLNGVGVKVASCVALFGFHRLAVCPQDVWMNRVLAQKYGGSWPAAYRPVLGVLQQYMFYGARSCGLL